MARKEEGESTLGSTLRRIGYVAAAVSGAGATVYAVSNALSNRDAGSLWMLDELAAPPRAIQRRLREVMSEEEEAAPPTRVDLERQMRQAMAGGYFERVQVLSRQLDELQEHEHLARTDSVRRRRSDAHHDAPYLDRRDDGRLRAYHGERAADCREGRWPGRRHEGRGAPPLLEGSRAGSKREPSCSPAETKRPPPVCASTA